MFVQSRSSPVNLSSRLSNVRRLSLIESSANESRKFKSGGLIGTRGGKSDEVLVEERDDGGEVIGESEFKFLQWKELDVDGAGM